MDKSGAMCSTTDFVLFVTHVEAEDVNLQIWGQVEKSTATRIEHAIFPLIELFGRGEGCPGPQSNLNVNTICCARFQNDGYYRARVLSVRPDRTVVVQFIDYGNVEVLPFHEIHLLENIPSAKSLLSIPPAAVSFTLMNAIPINGIWDDKVIEFIKKTLCYAEHKVTLQAITNSHRYIKLWENNEDFAEFLVKQHMAIPIAAAEQFRAKYGDSINQASPQMYQQLNKKPNASSYVSVPLQNSSQAPMQCQGNVSPGLWQNMPSPCITQQKQVVHQPVQEALVFKSRVLDLGSKHEVYVSFVEDGPQKFSVQIENTQEILTKLMRDINSHPTEPLHEPPLPGSVCLGRYTQDKVLCRAVVMSVMENKCKLYYVDFGHTEVLPYTDIFQLPPQYINPRVLSIRLTLSGVKELNVTEEMKEYFKKIVSGKLLLLHVRPPEGPPLIQYGDLYDNGRNIKDILRQAFPTPVALPVSTLAYQPPKQLPRGIEEIVHVSFVESCKKFFVQLDNELKALDAVMNALAEYAKAAPTLSLTQITVGLPCVAPYETQWYRAQVLSVSIEQVKVLYVDYGNEETLSTTSLRAIHDELVTNLPAQAIKCIWNGWETLPSNQDVTNKFETLVLEKCLRIKVIDIQPDGIVVDLYDLEKKENIKAQLIRTVPGDTNLNVTASPQSPENEYSVKTVDTTRSSQSEDANKWNKKNQLNSWRTQESNTYQDKNKKVWKDEINEERQRDNKFDKVNSYRDGGKIDRPGRGGFANNRFSRDRSYNRNDQEETVSSYGKESRGGRRFRVGGNDRNDRSGGSDRHNRSSGSERTWSDKDSDTSSRGSNRRGRGGGRGNSRGRREGVSARLQNSRWEDKNSYKSGRINGDFNGGNKFKERKNFTNNSANSRISTFSDYAERKIAPPVVAIGTIKTCEVVFANSPSDFFVQLYPDYLDLNTLMEDIALRYENGGGDSMHFYYDKPSDIPKNTYWIAQYSEDLKWYRAVVRSVEENAAIVQFVDYGNTEAVSFDRLKPIQCPDFTKLSAQAIHCKLLAASNTAKDTDEMKTFRDRTEGKILEVEFVAEENGVFEVLLREMVEGVPQSVYINEEFSGGVDMTKAREEAENRKQTVRTKQALPVYAPLDAKWTTITYEPGTKLNVIVTWFTDPNNFYCQAVNKETEFRAMMNNVQKAYAGREPVTHELQVGSPVIAIFADDGALYRAEIVELNKLQGHLVQYVDFGNCAVVDQRKIYPVEKSLLQLPKQAFHCSLKNVVPCNGDVWSNANTAAMDNCFNADKYECTFHDAKDNKYVITLAVNGKDVAEMLVEKNLASYGGEKPASVNYVSESPSKVEVPPDVERVDINLLSGQTLRVKVSSVANASKFHIQLPSAVKCEHIITSYMADKTPEVMPRLSIREVCLGAGCLVNTSGEWRRAVVVNCSQSAGFDVKLIDTGAYDEILLDSMLALPGELAVMQNQAVECCLRNELSSLETDEKLRELIEGKEVIVHVEEVDNTRLIVKLYDLSGNKINLFGDSDEKISPICPMPILNSTHKVSVSFADNAGSIWIQRYSDYKTDVQLLEALGQHYSRSGKVLEPKENLLCAVKSMDGRWYRGKVFKCTENGAYVRFLDYGNIEEISHNRLMVLEEKFYLPYQLAVNASLSITLSGTDSEQIRLLQAHLSNRELMAVFYNVRKKWIVELFENGEKLSDKLQALDMAKKPSVPVKTEPETEEMLVGCRYDVSVSHADSPSQFWLQRVNEASILAEKQIQLQTEAPGFPAMEGIPEEGTSCVAIYSFDNMWYRAEIIDADEGITTVRFVDYGNTDVIVDKSANIRQIPDPWKSMKRYATKCRLDVMPVDSEDWSETTCERFENLVTSADSLQALVVANGMPMRVELFVNGKSVGETLAEEHHAVTIRKEEDLIDEIVDLELDPHSAFVSHINSPSEFWVQEEKSVADLEIMSDRFIVADMFPKIEEIQEGLLCVAKFPEDELWYRARVVSHNDAGTQVIYIDYGNSAISTEIRAIPEDLATVPPLSRKCSLALPEGTKEWSAEACEEFVKLAADGATIFLLDVLQEQETSLVKLTLNGQNVADLLAVHCKQELPIIEERLPPLGEENSPNVVVSHVNSPSEFWVQAESSMIELEVMVDRLQTASSFLPLNNFEVGTVCAAKFLEDGQWYRAKILSHGESGTEVLYIDYGNSTVTTELRMLPEDIVNIPTLSKRCALLMPSHVTSWSEEACKAFKELAADGATMFQFEVLDEQDPVHVQLNLNGKNIVDDLAALCVSQEPHTQSDEKETSSTEKQEQSQTDKKEEIISDENPKENVDSEDKAEVSGTEETTKFENDITEKETKEDSDKTPEDTYQSASAVTELSIDEIVGNMVKDAMNDPEATETSDANVHKPEAAEDNEAKSTEAIQQEKETQETVDTTETNVEETVSEHPADQDDNSSPAKTPKVEKIVPGSICRGVSEEEEATFPQERPESVPLEDKIVPGSINKGDDLQIPQTTESIPETKEPSSSEVNESTKTDSTAECKTPTTPKIYLEDKILAGSVSGSPVVEPPRPPTPKTPHSEKIVSGAVNAEGSLPAPEEEDEILTVSVEDNIPKYVV